MTRRAIVKGWSCESKVNGYRKHRWETMKGGDVLNPIIASMIHPGYRVRICTVCGYAMSERREKRAAPPPHDRLTRSRHREAR